MADQKSVNPGKTTALQYIRTIYLSLAAVIGLICFIMGASGAIKLALNHWFPVDNYTYYAPYEQSPCETVVVNGKQQNRTPEEVAACKQQEEANRLKQNQNDFNR